MVKLEPKLPPPSRRNLIRLEREERCAARLANPPQLGEPRETWLSFSFCLKAREHAINVLTFPLSNSNKPGRNGKRIRAAHTLEDWRRLLPRETSSKKGDHHFFALHFADGCLLLYPLSSRSEEPGNHPESSPFNVSCDQGDAHSPTLAVRTSICDEESLADSSSKLHEIVIPSVVISFSLNPCGLVLATPTVDLSLLESSDSRPPPKEDLDSTSLESLCIQLWRPNERHNDGPNPWIAMMLFHVRLFRQSCKKRIGLLRSRLGPPRLPSPSEWYVFLRISWYNYML